MKIIQTWQKRITIAGEVTSCLSASMSFGVHQPLGIADLTLPLPLPAHVVLEADVTVEAALDGVWLSTPLFTGQVRALDDGVTGSGATARVGCVGPAYRLTFPIGRLIFAGGAKSAAATIISSATHIGATSIGNYDDASPNGNTVDVTASPSTDSDFVWLAGMLHGTNSYNESFGDKKIKKWSRVEVWQAGTKRGYANFPTNNERHGETPAVDWTDGDEWDDFELYVAARIVDADGTITFRFVSGTKPGSSTRDNYEIDDVTWQTAGKQTIRQMVRGLCLRCGLATGQYDVYEVTDLDGDIIRLGGNGLVDAGQVVIERREQPSAFISRILDLFGFALFDCPDGVVRVRPFRGTPTGTAVATFTEGATILNVRDAGVTPSDVYNSVRIDGASGNDEDGKRFAYTYATDAGSVVSTPYIPDPPGERTLTRSSSLLVSTTLCQQAGEIAEVNNAPALVIAFETWPHVLRPAQVIQVNAPTAEFVGKAFVETIRTDIDASGFRMSVTAWAGGTVPLTETPDPDPAAVDDEPIDPRPDDEWHFYSPLASVQ